MGARDAPHRADGRLEGALVLGAGRCPKGGCHVSRMGCHNTPLGGGCVKDCCDVPHRNKCMQQLAGYNQSIVRQDHDKRERPVPACSE